MNSSVPVNVTSGSFTSRWERFYPGELTPAIAGIALSISILIFSAFAGVYMLIRYAFKRLSCCAPEIESSPTEIVGHFDDVEDDYLSTDPRQFHGDERKTTTFVTSNEPQRTR